MEIVTSRQNPAIKLIRSLVVKKHRAESGLFVAEGTHILARARSKGWEPEYIVATKPMEPWGKARRLLVAENLMAAIAGRDNPPEALGVFRQKWAAPPKEPTGLWLMLDGLRDPGNLGTIVRTTDAVAGSGIILTGSSCDPWAPDCVQATMGSIFAVPLVSLATQAAVALIRNWPGETVGASMKAVTDFRRTYRGPTLLVVGSESTGLSPEIAAACQTCVRIPMSGGTESLNAAVATALLLYEILRSAL